MQTSTPMTYQDLLEMPDDGKHYELIEGELYVNPSPVTRHQLIVRNISFALHQFLIAHNSGTMMFAPIDVVLADDVVLEPDIIVVLPDRESTLREKNVQGAPNLVIEVISDGSRRRDEVMKRQLYERYGVDEYWIVDPFVDQVTVLRRSGGVFVRVESNRVITTPLLPGFSLTLDDVFA